jgi:transposase
LKAAEHRALENTVSPPVQSGERLQALGVDLHSFHGIPYRRAAPKLEARLGVRLSVGTLEAAQTRIAERLKSAADCIYELLRRQSVLCADETGARAAGKN